MKKSKYYKYYNFIEERKIDFKQNIITSSSNSYHTISCCCCCCCYMQDEEAKSKNRYFY